MAVFHRPRPQFAQHMNQRRLAEQARFLIGKRIEFRSDKKMRDIIRSMVILFVVNSLMDGFLPL